ncbi:hypothetical protein BV22DRAFT_1082230, partial [Leucogyrophana mollusca]
MESTEGKTVFSLTVVGATGLSPSDGTDFYVVVEVDGEQGQTAKLAPSPQSIIEWNACFTLRADKASYIALRLYEHWKAVLPGHLGGDKPIWESRVTAEQLLGCGSKFTNMALSAKAPHEEGHLIVQAERTVHTEAERLVAGESLAKPRWQGEMKGLEPSVVCSVHDHAAIMYSSLEESYDREKLEQAVDHYRVSLDLRPAGHPGRSASLVWLADALSTRFDELGDRADIDEAIGLNREDLLLRPQDHPDHSTSLCNLASTLSTRFNEFGDRADLDEATELHRAALVLRPLGHPDHCTSLGNLALTLSTRFRQFGDGADLDEAIELNRAALALLPQNHPSHSTLLNNLASALSTRFSQFSDRVDLDEAIGLIRAVLALLPPSHPNYSTPMNNLALTLSARFKEFGNKADLDEAIELNHRVLALRPPGHPDHA